MVMANLRPVVFDSAFRVIGFNHFDPPPQYEDFCEYHHVTYATFMNSYGKSQFSESWVEDMHVVKHGDTYYCSPKGVMILPTC